MTQSNSEIKIIPPRAISRDNRPRDFSLEKPLSSALAGGRIDSSSRCVAGEEAHIKTGRRDFFKVLIPASGKLLTNLFRNVSVRVATVVEEVKHHPQAQKSVDPKPK